MQIPEAKLDEFILLYQRRFGVVLGRDQVLEKGLRLIRLVEVVSRAVASEQKGTQN